MGSRAHRSDVRPESRKAKHVHFTVAHARIYDIYCRERYLEKVGITLVVISYNCFALDNVFPRHVHVPPAGCHGNDINSCGPSIRILHFSFPQKRTHFYYGHRCTLDELSTHTDYTVKACVAPQKVNMGLSLVVSPHWRSPFAWNKLQKRVELGIVNCVGHQVFKP